MFFSFIIGEEFWHASYYLVAEEGDELHGGCCYGLFPKVHTYIQTNLETVYTGQLRLLGHQNKISIHKTKIKLLQRLAINLLKTRKQNV